MPWRVYYEDGSTFEGRTRGDWNKAPQEGVQVVISWPRDKQPVRWFYYNPEGEPRVVFDRDCWTGEDAYEIEQGWGRKLGSLIEDQVYRSTWDRACGDSIS